MNHLRRVTMSCLLLAGCADGPGAGPVAGGRPVAAPRWITTTGGCRTWDTNPIDGEQAVWTGACVDGAVDGTGRLLWNVPSRSRDGAGTVVEDRSVLVTAQVYTGTMRHGFEEGDGTLEVVDPGSGETRTTYRGRFVDGRMEGPGTVQSAQGGRYDGSFHLGMKDGQGITTYPNGARYEGAFRDGYWDGRGSLRFGHGSSYVGEFRRGRPDGQGRAVIMAADDGTRAASSAGGAPPLVLDGAWERGCFVGGGGPHCFRFGAATGRS